MDDDNTLDITRRTALAALGSVGIASAGAGLGTSAFFSDAETFANNQLTAGTLDMTVGWTETYSDWSADEGDGVAVRMYDGADRIGDATDLREGETGLPADDAWLIAVDDPAQFMANTREEGVAMAESPCDGLNVPEGLANQGDDRPVVDIEDVKPGDFGMVSFEFALCDNPGYVWLNAGATASSENGVTEPESTDPTEDAATVELLDETLALLWVDDGDGTLAATESTVLVDSLRNVLATLGTGAGVDLAGNLAAEAGGGTGRNCFSGTDGGNTAATHSVVVAWAVPPGTANALQSDGVTFDLGFYTEQCRRNDGVGLTTGLLGHYPLDGTADDASGNDYDGTVVGDVTFVPGPSGKAVTFDVAGRDGYVAIPDFPTDPVGAGLTITAWIRTVDPAEVGQRIFAADENDTGGYALSLGDPGPGAVRFYSRAKDTISLDTPTGVVDADTWHHVAGVYDDAAETRRLYVDGRLEATLQSDTGPWGSDSGPTTIGGETDASDESDRRFRGRIHDVHVYTRPLAASEIGALYDEG
jgi:predicted ribosomally synthesized peptide with SipW-like signal peptide